MIFGRAVKVISSLGVLSPCSDTYADKKPNLQKKTTGSYKWEPVQIAKLIWYDNIQQKNKTKKSSRPRAIAPKKRLIK